MDTSNIQTSEFDAVELSVAELEARGLPDDKEMVGLAWQMVETLVERVKPKLRFMTKPVAIPPANIHGDDKNQRAVDLGFCSETGWQRSRLFLMENGEFAMCYECRQNDRGLQPHYHYSTLSPSAWTHMPLRVLMAQLREIYVESEKRRKKYYDDVRATRQMFDGILNLMKPHPGEAQ